MFEDNTFITEQVQVGNEFIAGSTLNQQKTSDASVRTNDSGQFSASSSENNMGRKWTKTAIIDDGTSDDIASNDVLEEQEIDVSSNEDHYNDGLVLYFN
jgi:hypothetical protein